MNIKNNSILITGGATGIGFALAEAFLKLDNKVIICGRRADKLKEAEEKLPGLQTIKCDISNAGERKLLYEWISYNFGDVNILINNAGIQRRIDFKKGTMDLLNNDDEIETNLKALVHLSAYFIPTLLKRKEASIINVSSGLGFIPIAMFPIYSATKAATHSFCISLRHQLKDTPIKIFELIPPTVNTELKKAGGNEEGQNGISPSEVADALIKAMEKDEYEVTVGRTQNLLQNYKNNFDEMFRNMNH